MQKSKLVMSRTSALVTAAVMVTVLAVPIVMNKIVDAAGIPTSRKITLSTSVASATDVTYTVDFTTDQNGASSNINGVVIEFCGGSPIIGDTCTGPTGLDTNKNTLNLGTLAGLTSLSIDTTNSTANKVVLTGTNTSVPTATAVTIPLGSGALSASHYFTNPSTGNQTFYARILTFATAGAAQAYTSGTPGTYVDAGGVALSTANQIQITAKVQERLSFCVYDRANCAAGTSGIALGNFNGVLDPAGEYVDKQAKFDISTNALSGATVVLKGDTLKSGGFSITAQGGTAGATNPTNEQFGMCLWQSTGSGLTLPNATYNNASCNTVVQNAGPSGTGNNTPGSAGGSAQFGFNTTNTTSASGDTIATKPAGNTSTATLAFIGNISNTTEAGIYTTNLTLVATGTY